LSSARDAVAHCARPPKQFKNYHKAVRPEPVEGWTADADTVHGSTGSPRTVSGKAFASTTVSTGTAARALSSKQRISSAETRVVVNLMRRTRREAANVARSTRERRRHYGLLNRNAQRLQRDKKGRGH